MKKTFQIAELWKVCELYVLFMTVSVALTTLTLPAWLEHPPE